MANCQDRFIEFPRPQRTRRNLRNLVARDRWNAENRRQERYNCEWGPGTACRAGVTQFPRGIDAAVNELLEPATYARMRANAAAQSNRAVFEIPDMLERILSPAAK